MPSLLRSPPPRRLDRRLPAEQFRRLERELLALMAKHGFDASFAATGGFTAETDVIRAAMASGQMKWRNVLFAEVLPVGGDFVGNVVWTDGLTLGTPNSTPCATVEEAAEGVARILALCKWVFPASKVEQPQDVPFRLFDNEFALARSVVEQVRARFPADGEFVEGLVADADARLAALLPTGLTQAMYEAMPPQMHEALLVAMVTLAAANRFVYDQHNGVWAARNGRGRRPSN